MRFWRIALIAFRTDTTTVRMAVHFALILAEHGIARAGAAEITSVIGIASIVGRIVTKIRARQVAGALIGAVAFGLPALAATWILFYRGGDGTATCIAVLIGFALGSEIDVITYSCTRYFGLRHYGVLFGTIIGLLALASGVGPAIASFLFDAYGTYRPADMGTIPTFLLCSALAASLGSYPDCLSRPDAKRLIDAGKCPAL